MIMVYTEQHRALSGFFKGGVTDDVIPGTDIRVVKELFHSHNGYALPSSPHLAEIFKGFFFSADMAEVNNNFFYHIFMPEKSGKGVIILLHGLNERSWDKYFAWALRLASDTRRPVILFPIAYHMNRSPQTWFDRHAMMPVVAARLLSEPGAKLTTFANVALSTRMSISPQRFFLSGFQAVNDLTALIKEIKSGAHPHLGREGTTDIFAYSIGVMIAQVLMLSSEVSILSDSRFFLFCGGSVLNMMNGTSKLIMDSKAFDRLISFYIDEVEEKQKNGGDWFTKIFDDTAVGEAFYAMSSVGRLKKIFGDPFRHEDGRIKAITFTSDRVIPPVGISETMRGADVEVWTPDYQYTHENPFPVLPAEGSSRVDSTFERLFARAASFLI